MNSGVKKLLSYLLPVFLIALFVIIMRSGGYLKQPLGEDDHVIEYLQEVEDAVIKQNWDKAELFYEKANNAWGIVVKRVQFSVERVDILGLDHSLAYLKGAIIAKSKEDSIISIEEAKKYWEDLEN